MRAELLESTLSVNDWSNRTVNVAESVYIVCELSQPAVVVRPLVSIMNPFQAYDVLQMSSPPYSIKIEDQYCDPDPERDDVLQPSNPLPYMSTFSKPNGMSMFYPPFHYDFRPYISQHRRSPSHDKFSDSFDGLGMEDISSHHQPFTFTPSLGSLQVRETERFKHKNYLKPERRIADSEERLAPQEPSPENQQQEFMTKARRSFTCHACAKTFKFQTSLLRHNNKVHNSKYQCATCNRVFSRQAYLDVHTSKPNSSCFLGEYFRLCFFLRVWQIHELFPDGVGQPCPFCQLLEQCLFLVYSLQTPRHSFLFPSSTCCFKAWFVDSKSILRIFKERVYHIELVIEWKPRYI